jgi:hypothetical protein
VVERDPIERRQFSAQAPADLDDPPRFGQALETLKDAFVTEIQTFFDQPRLNTVEVERRRELPTVRKYAVGFGPGTDPYETAQRIVSDWHDRGEKLPHIAVTAVSGNNSRMTIGVPYVAPVQDPPRVEASTAGPYTLGTFAFDAWELQIATPTPGAVLWIGVGTSDVFYTVRPGDTAASVAQSFASLLEDVSAAFRLEQEREFLTLVAAEPNAALGITASAGITATNTVTPGTGEDGQLVVETDRGLEVISFRRLSAGTVPTSELARFINEQAKWFRAEVTQTDSLRLLAHGRLGAAEFIALHPDTSDDVLGVLEVGTRGAGGPGDTLAWVDREFQLATTDIGVAAAAATTGDVLPTVVLTSEDGANTGTFDVLEVLDDDTVVLDAPHGTPESFDGYNWFVGYRDDRTNTLRPPRNRWVEKVEATVSLSALAEDRNQL